MPCPGEHSVPAELGVTLSLSKGERPGVAITTQVPQAVLDVLRQHADVLDVSSRAHAEWNAALATATGVLVSSAIPIDAAFLDAAPNLKIVATWSVGYDNVDLDALRERGIVLTNTSGSLVETVADLTYALVIFAMRNLTQGLNWVRSGRWMQGNMPFGHDLEGATLGIVGFGQIGLAVAKRAQCSGMRVIYSNRTARPDDAQTGASYRAFDGLLAEADCVVLLVPLTPQTRGMFNDAQFAKMKPTAALVNVARGQVVDTAALVRALEQKKIAGAALDVTDPEPLPADHPLVGRDDVLIVPHVGSATYETRARMAMLAAQNLIAFFTGQPLPTPVTLPVA
ncbi:MAG TPA: D-glycerate dehydrogenase [Candidatus Limnocylindrales bacterium]|nr:D-glycerate dehydrogenase [Candidatus Limnocylindrales bacterium]